MFRSTAAPERARSPVGLHLGERGLGLAMGVWISLYAFVQFALHPRVGVSGNDDSVPALDTPLIVKLLAVIVLAGALPIALGALTFGVDFRRAKYVAGSLFLFCLAIPISLLFAGDPGGLTYVALIDYVVACIIVFVSTNIDGERVIRAFFLGMALTLAVSLVAVLIDHDYAWGRLMGRMAPNYWGTLAATMIIATLAVRRWIVKAPLIALGLFVLYAAQSRGEIAALSAALLLAGFMVARRPDTRTGWVWFALAIAGVLIAAFGSNYIINDLLRLHDRNRGLNSGLTGRADNWRDAWQIFVDHPWFGVGYLQHGNYLPTKLPVHNDYLATLADVGVIGFIGYLIFQFGGLCLSVARAWANPTTVNVAIAAYLFCFAIIGLLEPTGFHIGNTISMAMVLLSAWSWRFDPWPAGAVQARAGAAYWKAAPAPGE